jgi:murein DD-endopeptidase MepM/ murein hydrolase activator NlpD
VRRLLSIGVAAALLMTLSTMVGSPADAGILPTPPLPILPSLLPLPLPTLPLPTLPINPPIGQPRPPTTVGPGAPGPGTLPGAGGAPPAAGAPPGLAAPGSGSGLPASSDQGGELFPQPPVDPVTTPEARLAAQLNDVEHRLQYLHNVLVRTQADLDATRTRLGPIAPLITSLTSPAGASSPASDTPEGRLVALSAALADGQAELARRETEALSLQQQVTSGVAQTLASTVPASATGYVGGKLRRPLAGTLTSRFGNRLDPYYHVWQLHPGIDLAATPGTPILAAAGGRVTHAGWYGGYGNYTCIDHGYVNGVRLSTCYGHQRAIMVTPGQLVTAGQVIGQVGSTGASTGPHLHFEVRLGGRPVDPLPWL